MAREVPPVGVVQHRNIFGRVTHTTGVEVVKQPIGGGKEVVSWTSWEQKGGPDSPYSRFPTGGGITVEKAGKK